MNAAGAGPTAPPPDGAPGHARLETLVSYLRAELPEVEVERLRDHLVDCPRCVELLLDLEAFEHGDAPAGADGEGDREASWERLRAARPWQRAGNGVTGAHARTLLGIPGKPLGPAWWRPRRRRTASSEPEAGDARPRLPSRRGTAVLLAASLAAATGLGAWSLHLHHRQAAPRPDQVIVELHAHAVTRGGEPAADVWRVPRSAWFTALIYPDTERPFPAYDVAILGPEGEALWRGRLTPADAEMPYLTLGLSRRLLGARSYRLRLWGVDGSSRVEAGDYPLEFAE